MDLDEQIEWLKAKEPTGVEMSILESLEHLQSILESTSIQIDPEPCNCPKCGYLVMEE